MGFLTEMRFRLGSAVKAHELHETIRELRRRDVLFDPSELVWIFSSGRSGTTWLKNILRDCGIATWEEPMIGEVLGFVEEKGRRLASSPNWIASDAHRPAFLAGVRAMVLHSAASRFDRLVIVKEPNGSEGAPMLSAALPESRVVCVVRDPRDVIASSFDGKRAGSWQAMRHPQAYWVRENSADSDPLEFTRLIAGHAMTNMSGAVAAYERHAGPRCLLTYEALREDALREVRRLTETLRIDVEPERLREAVGKNDWKNIKAEKGEGKFYRKAEPGSWREDLTKEQVQIVEEIAGPLMERFGYDRTL